MSSVRERFRDILSRPGCTLAANIFDPLSARIAHMLDYEVCFLSGSVGKVANLGIPDIVLSNMSDLVNHFWQEKSQWLLVWGDRAGLDGTLPIPLGRLTGEMICPLQSSV